MSVYANEGGPSGSVYATKSSAGSAYSTRGQAAAAKKKRGGLLGTLEHIVTQTPADLVDIAYQIPGGLYEIHKALAEADPSNLSHFGHSDTERLQALGKAYVDSTVETLQHPLRHPGYTALTVLPVVGAASRGAIGASTAARTGSLSAGAKAAVSSPPKALGSRELRVGDTVSRGNYSRAASAAVTQRAVDSFLQRAKPGTRRENLLHRRAAKWNERQLRVEEAKARSAGTRVRKQGQKLNDAQQLALRVVAEEVPVDRRVAALEQRIGRAEGRTAQRLQKRLDLLRQASEYLDAGPDGKPRIRADQEQLRAAYGGVSQAAGERGEILSGLGVLEPEAQQAAKTKASRFAAGARWEEPTAAKLGISPAVERAEARVGRLQKGYDRAVAQREKSAQQILERLNRSRRDAPAAIPATRPRTRGEAEARLAQLEKSHDKQVEALAKALYGPIDKHDVAKRNVKRGIAKRKHARANEALRKRGFGPAELRLDKTAKEERFAAAEQWAFDQVAKLPEGHEVRQAWDRRVNEINELRAALSPDPDEVFGAGPKAARSYGEVPLTPEEIAAETARRAPKPGPRREPAVQVGGKVLHGGSVLTPRGGAKAERLGGALSVAKEDLEAARARAAANVKPTGVVGAEDITVSEGAPFIGNPVERGRITGRPKVSSSSTFGHTRKPGSLKRATGGAVEKALERNDVTEIVAERHAEAVRLDTIRRRVDLVKDAGSPVPLRKDDVWLWTDETVSAGRIPPEVRRYIDSPDGIASLPERQQQSVMDRVKAAYMERHNWEVDDEARAAFEQLAREGRGVFVPRRLLGDAGKMSPNVAAIPGMGVVDAVNNAQKAALVYLKINYPVIQALSNTAMNIIQQGFAFPANSAKAWRAYHQAGPEVTAIVEDIMGAGAVVQASLTGTGRVSHASQVIGAKMSHAVDRPARLSAFYYEADKAGFGTPQKLTRLIEDDTLAPRLGEVAQRAKEAIVDYGEMGPTERQLIRRLLFVYPWQKGALKYSGHFLRDHPVQAAALGMVGARGQQISDETLGPVPSYLQGVFDVGGGRLVNPAGVNFFQTPAQQASAVGGYLTGNPAAPTGVEFLSPFPGLAVAEATRRDDFGRPLAGNVAENAERTLVEGTPLYEALRAAAGGGRSSNTFPNRNDALYRFLIGGLYPRQYNRGALNQNAARQQAGR